MQHHPEEFVLPFEKTNKQTKKTCHQFPLQMHFLSKPTLVSKQILKTLRRERGRREGRGGWMQCCMLFLMSAQTKQNLCNCKFTCSNETLLANSFIRSLALMMIYGSKVFFVVQTVMLPSIRSRVALTCYRKESANERLSKNAFNFR